MGIDNSKRITSIAERIKKLRIDAGYTSYENFALDKGLDRKQYWRLEKGQNFKIETLFRLLDIHQITLEDFFKELS
ncbi:helix-turn-helix domain-containing protein [Tenacibaculum sp. ZS6-P6]|uniref:helix-turn-helix domain-containing protein n=1 Tax=Tenacibaculum sp. ZS6-P6 TaxID=3447503 RepID=UPI003F96C2FE